MCIDLKTYIWLDDQYGDYGYDYLLYDLDYVFMGMTLSFHGIYILGKSFVLNY